MKRAAGILPTMLLTALLGGAGLYTPDRSRGWLEAWYLDGADTYRDAAGIRPHVRDTGSRDAPALILLHGFGSSLQIWDG